LRAVKEAILVPDEKNTYLNIESPQRREVLIISKVKKQKGGITRKEVYPNLFTRSEEGMRIRSIVQIPILFSDGSSKTGVGLRLCCDSFIQMKQFEELAS
jgi:hypothetical protein